MTLDLKVFKEEDRTLDFTVKEDGSAVDISSATIWFIVKNNIADENETAVIEKSRTDGGTDGTVTFDLSSSDTDIPPRAYEYEVKVNFDDGTKYPAEIGDFLVQKSSGK